MDIANVIQRIERTAPLAGACSWDRSGVQIAGRATDVRKLAVALDPLPETVAQAVEWGAECILTHHPLTMQARFLDKADDYHETARLVLSQDAWLYAAHTSLDAQPEGPAGWLARELGMRSTEFLETTFRGAYRGALLAEAVGSGLLDAWAALPGVAQARQEGSGHVRLAVREDRFDAILARVAADLGHIPAWSPYTPSIEPQSHGLGFVGDLAEPVAFDALVGRLGGLLDRSFFTRVGEAPDSVSRLAYCTGSGASLADAALAAGAQLYVTGDMKYHQAQDHRRSGLCILDVGHFSLEEEMMRRFALDLNKDPDMAGVETRFFAGTDPMAPCLPSGA